MANPDEKNIVIARLQTMPEDMSLSVGSHGTINKWELIDHVKKEDSIGELVVKVYMTNLRAFKEETVARA